ncbi:MAG: hypothetical protein ABIP33_12880 [Pseudolysinimonas sp.]
MSLHTELQRFEALIETRYPEYFPLLNPPADDERIEHLVAAIGDLLLPADVEEIYRWHDGGSMDAIMGRRFLSIDEMLAQREFDMGFDEPPVWLPMFNDIFGARLFVEAGVDGFERDPSIWNKGKDWGPQFSFRSLESLFASTNEVLERGLVNVTRLDSGHLIMSEIEDGSHGFAEEVRRRLNPVPDGIRPYLSFFPAIDWSEQWLASIGVDRRSRLATGDNVVSISQLLEDSVSSDVTRTVSGRRMRFNQPRAILQLLLRDASGDLYVEADAGVCAFEMPGLQIEIDVEAGPSIAPQLEPFRGSTAPFARAIAMRFVPVDPE